MTHDLTLADVDAPIPLLDISAENAPLLPAIRASFERLFATSAFVLGAGTLRDIALALFIGILVGAYSTIFIAAPVYVQLRENEPAIKKHDAKAMRVRERDNADSDGELDEAVV